MVPAFVNNSRGDVFLNQLLYSIKGGVLAASSNQNPLVMASAGSATAAGTTVSSVMESALEAVSEIHSTVGEFETFLTGTVTGTAGSAVVPGLGTLFLKELTVNQYIMIDPFGTNPETVKVSIITSDVSITLSAPLVYNHAAGTPVYIAYQLTGTVSGTAYSTTLTGVGTAFTNEVSVGDFLTLNPFGTNSVTMQVQGIASDTSLTFSSVLRDTFTSVNAYNVTDSILLVNSGRVTITDTANRRAFMNRPILLNHVFGAVGKPFYLPESILIRAQQPLQFDFQNLSPYGYINARYCLEMRKFQQNSFSNKEVTDWVTKQVERKKSLFPYWLTNDSDAGDPVVIPAGGVKDVFFTPDKNLEMVIFKAMEASSTTGQAGDFSTRYVFEIYDAATERPLFNQPIARPSGAGTSQFPYNFPAGLLIEANTKLHVRFTNLVTSQATNVNLTFHGVANTVNISN